LNDKGSIVHFRKSTSAVAVAALFGVLPLGANGQSASYAGSPYTGTAPSVPVVIPAVNFDKGGAGVAYHDRSTANLGGQYRPSESVDIYRSSDNVIGPYEVANFQTGEWMNYTVNVPASGTYVLSIRASNNQATGAFHIEVDGVNVTGTISVPKTGGWNRYEWFGKKAVVLSAGKHVVKIVSEKQWFNVTALSIQSSGQIGYTGTPYSGTPYTAPATFPAVNFDKGGDGVGYHDLSPGNLGGLYRASESVDIYPSLDSVGGPYKVQNFQTGEWMTYTIDVPTGGNYDLGIRSANNLAASGAFRMEVDGVNVTGSIPVTNTGGWDAYQWFGKKGIPLTAGKHVLKLVSEQEWFDVSAITVLPTSTGGSTGGGTGEAPTNGYAGTPYNGTPIAAPATFPAVNFDKGGEGIAYHDLSSGNLGGLYRTSESVDIYSSKDSAVGPYKVQNFQTGEWMSYTVDVPASGNYDIGIRAANNLTTGTSGAFHIEVDGVNVTGSVSVPITGSWDTYQWFGKKAVPLTAGKHVIKLISEQQWFDVSALTVLASSTSTGSTDTPSSTPLWSAGMEAGNLVGWYENNGTGPFTSGDGIGRTYGNNGEYSEASKEQARSGSWSAKLAITASQESAVRLWRMKESKENRELYYSLWYFIPHHYKVDAGGWNNVLQYKSATPDGKHDPFFLLGWTNDATTGAMHLGLHWWQPSLEGPLPGQSGKRTWRFPAPMPTGRWFNIEVRYACAGDFTGTVQVWQDGVQMIKLEGVRTRYLDGNCLFAVTNYATKISPLPYYFYVDDVVISRTRVWQ
jgi:hypothetical protein